MLSVKGTKKVLALCGVLALSLLAVLLYFRLRGFVGGVSPYGTVNDLYEWEVMTFTAEREVYPTDVDTVRLYFQNDASDGVVCLSAGGRTFWYELELWQDDAWHQLRANVKDYPRWKGETDIVSWSGGEVVLSCDLAEDYPASLRPGRYRIVLPECEHLHSRVSALAVEFEV